MGYTLDQLLETTGVSELSGGRLVKKANAPASQNLSKLAERCRRAVDATPDEVVASNQQDLVEKTAAVAVIGRTLAEIEAIDGGSPEAIKTASATHSSSEAAFIKAALDAGHTPYEIAEFMEKNALFGRIGRGLKRMKATHGFRKAERLGMKAEAYGKRNLREWQDLIRKSEKVPDAEKAALISRMRRDLGDQSALNALTSVKGHGFKDLPSFKDLQKAVPAQAAQLPGVAGAKPLAAGVNIGGTQVGLTSEQLKKMKKPALYAGAGFMGHRMLTGGGDSKQKSSRGPVIITG
jgi:hypothetical protein